jgi:hypothetical protein
LYVDVKDGAVLSPADISQREAAEAIAEASGVLANSKRAFHALDTAAPHVQLAFIEAMRHLFREALSGSDARGWVLRVARKWLVSRMSLRR